MIWLASYPRSGNTFLRIVLREVYGIESSTFHRETRYPVDEDYDSYPVVKTHLLPDELEPDDASIPAVLLVRDGRDACVSMARQACDIARPGSDYYENLREIIETEDSSHFGGWSRHFREWQKRAQITIRFEELIADPIACAERLRPFLDLPKPNADRLPTFEDLRKRDFAYGSGLGHNFSSGEREKTRKAWFRRGKVGSWKEEMPDDLEELFFELHGDMLLELGYDANWCRRARSFLKRAKYRLPWHETPASQKDLGRSPRRVLIEATKLLSPTMDGHKRYVLDLCRGLLDVARHRGRHWRFDLYMWQDGDTFCDILTARDFIESGGSQDDRSLPRQKRSGIKEGRGACRRALAWLIHVPIRRTLKFILPLFARDFLRKVYFSVVYPFWVAQPGAFDRYDLVHLTAPNLFAPFARCRAKLVTTVHDLCHLECPELQRADNVDTLENGLQHALQKGTSFIAVSEATKRDLIAHHGLNGQPVHVVLEACDRERFRPVTDPAVLAGVRQKYDIPDGPYLLSVATLEPRKNLESAVRAFLDTTGDGPGPKPSFVIAGQRGWKVESLFDDKGLQSDRVIYTGHVSDEDLPALYSGAMAMVYVSHYEGFGLPPLEAMSCGVPVIYGNNSSMPEVIADAGLPADSNDIEDIKEQLRRIIVDEELRAALSERARARAETFSLDRMIEETVAVYEEAIAK